MLCISSLSIHGQCAQHMPIWRSAQPRRPHKCCASLYRGGHCSRAHGRGPRCPVYATDPKYGGRGPTRPGSASTEFSETGLTPLWLNLLTGGSPKGYQFLTVCNPIPMNLLAAPLLSSLSARCLTTPYPTPGMVLGLLSHVVSFLSLL